MKSDIYRKRLARKYHEERTLSVWMPEIPIKIFDLSYSIDADQLLKDIFSFKEKYPRSMHEYQTSTCVNAWHSDFLSHHMTEIFSKLIEVQLEKVKEFGLERRFEVEEIWANVYKKGDCSRRHWHGPIGFSSIYYVYVEKNPTPVIFDNGSSTSTQFIEITPEKNKLIMFPSFLYHSVPAVSETLRVSVAANLTGRNSLSPRDAFSFQSKET